MKYKISSYKIEFILLLLISCEGDSYCVGDCYDWMDSNDWQPMDKYDDVNAYLIECLEDEVPVALVNDGYYISGNIEEYSFTRYDNERNDYNYDYYYGIFCLEKGENTYSLSSDISNNDYDGLFLSNGPGNPSMCDITISNLKKYIRMSVSLLYALYPPL